MIFGTLAVSRFLAPLSARRAVRAGRALPAFLRDRLAIATAGAPTAGEPPFWLDVAADGTIARVPRGNEVTAEAPEREEADSDLRKARGTAEAELLLRRGYATLEELSQQERRVRSHGDEIDEVRERQREFIDQHPSPARLYAGALAAAFGAVVLSAGEIAALTVLFADWFGLDLARGEFRRYPVEAFGVVLAAAGLFVASLMLAHVATRLERPMGAVTAGLGLLGVGVALGFMRGRAIPNAGWEPVAIFVTVTVAMPLAAAVFLGLAATAWAAVGDWHQLTRQERQLERWRREAEVGAREADAALAAIVSEYAADYAAARAREAKERAEWLLWLRHAEASLAVYRNAYLTSATPSVPKRLVSAGTLRLASLSVLALLLALGACGRAEPPLHVVLLCDRSSSGAENSCPSEVVTATAGFWADSAAGRGGSFEVWILGGGIDIALFARADYPERFAPPVSRSRREWRTALLTRLEARSAALPVEGGSAFAEGLWRIARRVKESGVGRHILVVAGDLRQVTPGTWNFERWVPEPRSFVAWVERQRLTPALPPDTRVVVCGVHSSTPPHTSRATAATYAEVRALWSEAFSAWGLDASITERCGSAATEGGTP